MNVFHLFYEASLVVKFVMLILVAMSCYSWGVIAWKFWSLSYERRNLAFVTNEVSTKSSRVAEGTIGDTPIGLVIKDILVAHKDIRTISKNSSNETTTKINGLEQIIKDKNMLSIYKYKKDIDKGIYHLATIGSVAPYIGLFGTVWGLLVSFHGLATVKVVTIQTVAPGIIEALVATALGLLTAIPAYVFYNNLSKKSSDMSKDLMFISQQITTTLSQRSIMSSGGGGDK